MRQELVYELDTHIGIAEAELECAMDIKGYDLRTKELYLYHLRKFMEFTDKDPRMITLSDARRYILHIRNHDHDKWRYAISAIRFLFTDMLDKNSFKDLKIAY